MVHSDAWPKTETFCRLVKELSCLFSTYKLSKGKEDATSVVFHASTSVILKIYHSLCCLHYGLIEDNIQTS